MFTLLSITCVYFVIYNFSFYYITTKAYFLTVQYYITFVHVFLLCFHFPRSNISNSSCFDYDLCNKRSWNFLQHNCLACVCWCLCLLVLVFAGACPKTTLYNYGRQIKAEYDFYSKPVLLHICCTRVNLIHRFCIRINVPVLKSGNIFHKLSAFYLLVPEQIM